MGLVGRIDFKDPSLSLPTSEITGANNKTHSIKSGFIIHGITSGNLTGSMCFLAYSKLMCKKAVNIYIYSLLLKLIHISTWNDLTADLTMFPWFSCPLPGNLALATFQPPATKMFEQPSDVEGPRKILTGKSHGPIAIGNYKYITSIQMMAFSTRRSLWFAIKHVLRVILPGWKTSAH